MGGVADEVADALRQRGKYDEFLQLVDKQYRPLIATKPLLKGSGFALPRTKIPTDRLAEYAEKKEAA